jgi:phosphoribosyl 1,2-cyclic phosphodiesterase
MTGAAKPKIMKIDKGTSLVRQGEKGSDVYLILDGVLRIDVTANGWRSTDPGRCLGERAHLEGGLRTSSIVAVTNVVWPRCRPSHWTARRSSNSLRDTAGKTRARANPVRVHLLGVRGSTPAPGSEFVRYGGHTSCVAIAHDDDAEPTLVLDAGTGIRRLSELLGGAAFHGTILLSHLHWDHTHGLPFFRGGDREDARVNLFVPDQQDGSSAFEILARGMSPPHFPIGPDELRGEWSFTNLDPGTRDFEGFEVTAVEIPHKGGRTFGYRVSDGHSTLAYMSDHCPVGPRSGARRLGRVSPGGAETVPGRRRAHSRRVAGARRSWRRSVLRTRGG